MKWILKPASLDAGVREDVDELTGLLKNNLEKVVQHGKRADSIVKNMLLHSREGSGDHRPADINALVDESLNLAYHGARAEKPDFNATLQHRGRHHEDDEQHEHDIDQRDDVHLRERRIHAPTPLMTAARIRSRCKHFRHLAVSLWSRYVKFRSAMFKNSSAKSSMVADSSFTRCVKWL